MDLEIWRQVHPRYWTHLHNSYGISDKDLFDEINKNLPRYEVMKYPVSRNILIHDIAKKRREPGIYKDNFIVTATNSKPIVSTYEVLFCIFNLINTYLFPNAINLHWQGLGLSQDSSNYTPLKNKKKH